MDKEKEKDLWKNRRRMAWIAFISMVSCIAFFMFKGDVTTIQADGLKYFGLFMSSIVLAYIGGNVVEKIKGK